jgi:REP element-mobilizing transposase RayT
MKSRIHQPTFKQYDWGGKRHGAGRKPKGTRAGVSHAKRPELKSCNPVHVTLRVADDMPSLRVSQTLELFHRVVRAVNGRIDFQVVEFSLQRNHAHLIVEVESKAALSRAMNSLVARFARGLNKLIRRRGKVFPDRYHAEAVDTPAAVRNLLVYVLGNGRKHGVWSGGSPDPFSSGAQFDGWADWKGAEPRWLPRARTWLLSVGWRRHGLISVREAPKSRSIRARASR